MTRDRKSSRRDTKSQDRHKSSRQTNRSPRKDDKNKSKSRKRRSRSKSPHKSNKKAKTKSSPEPKDVIVITDEPLDKESEQERLEKEMQKRRERIEQWRATRKQKSGGGDVAGVDGAANEGGKWTLEDDDDEEEADASAANKQQLPDLDPLDAYMLNVNEEVKKIKDKDKKLNETQNVKSEENSFSVLNKEKFRIVTAVAKKNVQSVEIKKPELMESNADAIEYSSEEEVEGLDDQMDKLNKKKKELMAIDHSKIYYHPFRKNFYVEVPEITKMTSDEVEVLRMELDNITVRGKSCPTPITSWAQCGVSKKLLEALKKNNFEKPTPIQAQALPIIMSGRDLIGIAKTGSGKTLAFILPMLRHILDQPHLQQDDGPIAIILTPTRELAMQIGAECRKVGRSLGVRVACVYGGAGISDQIGELRRGVEVVVCTPGRMIDMLAANNGRVTNLRRCTYLVLDEADRMFDMGFEPQVMKIVENVRPDRQTVMFSATFPRQMESLARRILTKPLEITVGGRSVVPRDVQQFVIILEDHHKFLKLLELLGIYQEQGSVLVFVHKQEHADELMKNLLKHAYPCLSLHGGIDQYDRDSSIDDFKQGNVKLLIATSVCSRGLDVKDLNLVVNYDCPNHYEDYVHRCGRTGRAGNKGFAYTFVSPSQGRHCGDLINALTQSKQPIPPELQQLWDSYKTQAEADGVKLGGLSGFKGKGFKFDADEAQLADDRKKLQKQALGIHDSDDEDAGLNIDQKIEKLFASKKKVSEVAMGSGGGAPAVALPAANQEKLELAKKVASIIHLNKHIGPEASDINLQTAAAIFKGAPIAQQSYNSKTVAEQMAESINARLGYQPTQAEERPSATTELPDQPTTKKFEEEIEINDFPQTARFKVTSREALRSIGEFSDAGLTVRGAYIAGNKEPREGERKLYLAIEADNELSIQKAKAEVARIIKEELVRLQNSYQPLNRSRYTVV